MQAEISNHKKQFHQKIALFILFYGISRFFMLLTPGFTTDFYEYAVWGDAILRGQNIYEQFQAIPQGLLTLKYPPLFFLQCALILLLFGYYSWSIRLGFMCFEIFTLIILYYFSTKFPYVKNPEQIRGSQKNLTILYLFAFSPSTIFNLVIPQPWFLGSLYMMIGLIAFYIEKPKIMAVFLCIGFLTEFFPLFCLIPIILYYLCVKKWKEFFQMVYAFIITLFACCLPFILLNANSFLVEFLIQFSRVPQTASFWSLLENIFNLSTFVLFGGFVEINYLGLTFIIFSAGFSIMAFSYLKKQKNINRSLILWLILIYFFCLPLVFMSFDVRYFFWYLPLACLFYSKNISLKKVKWWVLSCTIFSIIYGSVFLIYWPDLLVVDQRILLPQYQIHDIYIFSLSFLAILVPFFLIFWIVLGKQMPITLHEVAEPNIHQVITLSQGLFLIELVLSLNSSVTTNILFTICFFIGFLLNLKSVIFLVKNITKNNSFELES